MSVPHPPALRVDLQQLLTDRSMGSYGLRALVGYGAAARNCKRKFTWSNKVCVPFYVMGKLEFEYVPHTRALSLDTVALPPTRARTGGYMMSNNDLLGPSRLYQISSW